MARFVKNIALLLGAAGAAMAAMVVLSPPGAILAAVVAASIMRTIRRRRAMVVLGYLEQAVRLNMPLGRVLRAAHESERGWTALRLFRLRESIEAGAPLAIALEADVPEMPRRIVRMIQSAERLGRLPAVLRDLATQERKREPHGAAESSSFNLAYPLVVMGLMCGVVGMLTVFVMPKFQQIMKDFRIPAPTVTRALIWFAGELGPVMLWAAVVMVVGYAGMQVAAIFRRREPAGLFLRDWLVWHTPLLGQAACDRGMADVCQVLAEALRVGHPLDRAMLEAEELHVNQMLGRRVCAWRVLLREGLDSAEAARRAQMPKLLVGMLGTAQASGRAAEVFEFLARYYRGRFSRTALLLKGSVLPAMTIVCGIIVCLVALSLFMPMIRMVEVNLKWGTL